VVQEVIVDILFEGMWLASIVEHSDDAIRMNLHGIVTSWDKASG
jgi:hypothetical protein